MDAVTRAGRGMFMDAIRDDSCAQDRVRDWISALRSGEYRQSERALRTGDGYCCLGVACDLFDTNGWRSTDGGNWCYEAASERSVVNLPPRVRDAYALASMEGKYQERRSLMHLNDTGHPFGEIADFIEANLNAALTAREAR